MDIRKLYDKIKKDEEPLSCAAVIVAAGSSERMGFDKLTVMLDGIPVLMRAAQAFDRSPLIEEIVIVTREDRLQEMADLCRQYQIGKIGSVVCGGATRTASVFAGVMALRKNSALVAVHDGARPFVSQELIAACVEKASVQYAAIPVLRSTDSLRGIDEKGVLLGSLDREKVVRVQTPQVFQTDLLKGALSDASAKGLSFTDDATAVERMGLRLQAVEGDEENIKLTTPEDFELAKGILERKREQA